MAETPSLKPQNENQEITSKLYRYQGLMQAIEFLSQRVSLDQLTEITFDVVNELLVVEKSAMFTLDDGCFKMIRSKGFDHLQPYSFPETEALKNFASFYGTIILEKETFLRYFDQKELDTFGVTFTIPLCIENTTYGFIFVCHKSIGDFNDDDHIISQAIMHLVDNALENLRRYEQLNKANTELDEKVFNLFAINHSSRALLSELNLDTLNSLSVDVFSELTQSSLTGFFVYSEVSEVFELCAFKDVFFKKTALFLQVHQNPKAQISNSRVIININDPSDLAYFKHLFVNAEDLIDMMTPQFIVLLIKNSAIHGMVTLAETVTGYPYKESNLELIESLATSTFIALSNAHHFKDVLNKNKIIEAKLNRLIALNTLMANINSALSVESMVDLTLKTLEVSFGVEKAFFAFYDKQSETFNVSAALGINKLIGEKIKPTASWKHFIEGDVVFDSKTENVSGFFSKKLMKHLDDNSGVQLIPIYIDRLEIEMIGAICILKYRNFLMSDEEMLLIMNTIANHISPVLYNLIELQTLRKTMLPDHASRFLADLKNEIEEADMFDVHLAVAQITHNTGFSFSGSHVLKLAAASFPQFYQVSCNHAFAIFDTADPALMQCLESLSVYKDTTVHTFRLGIDFKSAEDIKSIFEKNI